MLLSNPCPIAWTTGTLVLDCVNRIWRKHMKIDLSYLIITFRATATNLVTANMTQKQKSVYSN